MIGQRKNGDIILVSTPDRIVYEEMQQVMLNLECITAFGLDGGGSVFLWHKGKTLVQGERNRKVGNTIVIFEP